MKDRTSVENNFFFFFFKYIHIHEIVVFVDRVRVPTVCVKWRLHFEFVTSTKMSGERLDVTKEGTCWTGPEHVDIETMVWDLPIQIYPSVPSIANDPHAQTRMTIVI